MAIDKRLLALRKIANKYQQEQEENIYDPAKQVEGYKERIEGSGRDVEKDTDKRNIIEKALNLNEDQNPLFDLFEIINRPQQALFGAINASQKDENILKGAWQGLSGKKDTYFKDILVESGMEDTKGKFDATDALGLAGDIFLDPVDWAILPAKGLMASKKALKAASDSLEIADKGLDAVRAGRVIDDAAEQLQNTYDLAKKAKEAAQSKFTKLSKQKNRSLSQLAVSGLGTGFKKSFRLADSGFEKLFTYMDNSYKKMVTEAKFLDGKAVRDELNALKSYTGMKEMIGKTFNLAKYLPEGFLNKARKVEGKKRKAIHMMREELNKVMRDSLGSIDEIALKYGYTSDEVSEMLYTIYEKGGEAFDKSGKITLKGMNKKVAAYNIIDGDSYLKNMGLTEANAQKFEYFVKTFFKDWYDANITNGTIPFFTKYTDETGTVVDVYRMDDALHESLRKELKKVSDDLVLPADESIAGVRKAYNRNKEHLEAYQQKLDNGATKVVPFESDAHKVIVDDSIRINNIDEELETLKDKLSRQRKPNTKATTEARIEALVKERVGLKVKINKLVKKNQVDLADEIKKVKKFIDNTKAKFTTIDEMNIKKALEGAEGVYTDGSALGMFDVNMYLSDASKAKIEKFIAEVDEVPEMLASMHEFMTKATKHLKDELDWAYKNVPPEGNGYLSHVITDAWYRKNMNQWDTAGGKIRTTRTVQGNSQVVASRKYEVSAMEANALSKSHIDHIIKNNTLSKDVLDDLNKTKMIDMFSTDIKTSFVDFMNKTANAGADAKMLQMVLTEDLLNNKSLIRMFERGDDVKIEIPHGFREMSADALVDKFNEMSKFLDNAELSDLAKNWFELNKGKIIYIDNNIDAMIGVVTKPKAANPMLEMVDKINAVFKKNKLLSPGFQLRNVVGNMSNMYLSGVPLNKVMSNTAYSIKVMKQGDKLWEIARSGSRKLSVKEQKMLDEYIGFVENGFAELGNALHDIPKELWDVNAQKNHWKNYTNKKKINPKLKPNLSEKAAFPKHAYNSVVSWNMKANQHQDSVFRFALWKYGKENKDFLLRNGYDSPESLVRRVLFDFQDLSVNERDTMRKLIPFYTFTKKNLALQLSNIQKNTPRYNKMIKSFRDLWGSMDLEENEVDKFKIENFWVPIPFVDKDGKYKAIKSSLPLGDLGEFLESPFKRTLSATAPIVRAPFEIAANKQIFSEMPIQEFKGQKGFYLPELPKKAEYGLSQLGLDVPAMAAFDIGRTAVGVAKGNKTDFGSILESGVGRTVVSTGDINKTATRNAYEELDDLQNLMRYYKQENIDIKTLDEIENAKKFNSQKEIIARIRAIRG